MKDNDLITRREVELALLEKGQETERYKWGEQWELNFSEIREALSEYQSEIVRCKDCKHLEHLWHMDEINGKECYVCRKHTFTGMRSPEWFCADGERLEDEDEDEL